MNVLHSSLLIFLYFKSKFLGQTNHFLIVYIFSTFCLLRSVLIFNQKEWLMKQFKQMIGMIGLLLSFVCAPVQAVAQQKSTTFLVYMAADNSLRDFAHLDIQEMSKVGTNDDLNVLVYYCTSFPNQYPKVTRKFVVYQSGVQQDGPDEVRDSGDVETLYDACAWALQNYPADNVVVVFWNHGSGMLNRDDILNPANQWWSNAFGFINSWRGVCYDDTTSNFLTDAKLVEGLQRAANDFRNGQPYEVIAFDACLMADLEVAYALKSCAKYMVASQETIPGEGYSYDSVLKNAQNGITDVRQFASGMVDAYNKSYQGVVPDYTLSATDLSLLDPLTKNVNDVATKLKSLVSGPDRSKVKAAIKTSVAGATKFDTPTCVDLSDLYGQLVKQIGALNLKDVNTKAALIQALQSGATIIKSVVFAKAQGSKYPHAGGLSIYVDLKEIDSTYPELIWSKANPQWNNFLSAYLRA
jgi:hypothetical protein